MNGSANRTGNPSGAASGNAGVADSVPGTARTGSNGRGSVPATSYDLVTSTVMRMLDELDAKAMRLYGIINSENASNETVKMANRALGDIDFVKNNVFLFGSFSRYEVASAPKFEITLREYMMLDEDATDEERKELRHELTSLRSSMKKEANELVESRMRAEMGDNKVREEAAKQAAEETKKKAEETKQAAEETKKKAEEVKLVTKEIELTQKQIDVAGAQEEALRMAAARDRHAARSWFGRTFFNDTE
jgi:hypothetical protein